MNMLTSVLIKLGLAIFSALPIERILAILLNKWLDKIDAGNLDKATKTATHLAELSQLFSDILEDKKLTETEVRDAKDFVAHMREELLKIWAKGDNGKPIQIGIAATGNKADYAIPLLNDDARHGFAMKEILHMLSIFSVMLLVLLGGCLTRTRCQEISADTVYVTINSNDPDSLAENAYPRSMNILSQDQMVEGGSDDIASGNRTDPSLSVPMGDSALGAIGSMIGGAVRGYREDDSDGAEANADAPDGGEADCPGGDCSE